MSATPAAPGALSPPREELALLEARVESMRAVLVRLLQDVVRTESRLDDSRAASLLEANEQLVVAALGARTQAEAAAKALADASRVSGLDPLTDLPNRALMLDRLGHAIAQARRRGGRLALLFLDIDDFKAINDNCGHAVGDAVLRHVARGLVQSVREADTVSRHGGDEFLVLLTEVSQASDAALIADKVVAAVEAPCQVGALTLSLTASVGIGLYPDDGDDAATLIDRADAAMYLVKEHRRGQRSGRAAPATGAAAPRPAATEPIDRRLVRYEQALAAQEARQAQLQEVNEHLVLAALDAQELLAAAGDAQRRQAAFLDGVARELSDPMAPIRIATAMLGRLRTDEPLLPRAQAIIEQQAAQISRLVDTLRERAVAPWGLVRQPVDMVALMQQAVAACRPAMDRRRQTLELALPAGPLLLQGDPARLAQALANLLGNATLYTQDEGTIRLAAAVDAGSLVVTLTDDGIGITPEALPGVFDPFMQDMHAVGLHDSGLGIGLTAVREIVQAHGGHVVARSAGRGLGSCFVVTLPLPAAPADLQPSSAA